METGDDATSITEAGIIATGITTGLTGTNSGLVLLEPLAFARGFFIARKIVLQRSQSAIAFVLHDDANYFLAGSSQPHAAWS
jgi:hypothetical protein